MVAQPKYGCDVGPNMVALSRIQCGTSYNMVVQPKYGCSVGPNMVALSIHMWDLNSDTRQTPDRHQIIWLRNLNMVEM